MGLDQQIRKIIYSKNGDIVRRDIADEIILVPIRGNMADMRKVFVLDAVADFIWMRLDGKMSCGDIHTALLTSFDVKDDQAAEDLNGFIRELLQADLIGEVT